MFSVERRFGPWWREPTENLQWWLQRVIWQLLVGLLGHYRHAGYLFLPIKFPEFVSKCRMLGSNHLTVICFKMGPKWCLLSTQCARIRATCTHSHAFMQNFFLSRTRSWGCMSFFCPVQPQPVLTGFLRMRRFIGWYLHSCYWQSVAKYCDVYGCKTLSRHPSGQHSRFQNILRMDKSYCTDLKAISEQRSVFWWLSNKNC